MKKGLNVNMNKNEKGSIKKYNKLAGDYDLSFDGRFTVKFKRKILDFCNVSDGDAVLDVGCGNGSLINAISKKAKIKAYGIDISPNMIAECRKRCKNIDFQVSGGEVLPFDDNNFNVLIICCVLHHLNNPQKFFMEAHRVLKQGGILIVGEPYFPLVIRKFIDWIIIPIHNAGDNKMFSHKSLKRLFADNGFEIAEIYKKGTVQIIKGRKL
ncbi:MAG: class I SAM-dependent methyltransferase [Oscillospiraceae bacterium]|nr:class I SAM-dependent methyltransferase [Oscillospiraceae bacterium]